MQKNEFEIPFSSNNIKAISSEAPKPGPMEPWNKANLPGIPSWSIGSIGRGSGEVVSEPPFVIPSVGIFLFLQIPQKGGKNTINQMVGWTHFKQYSLEMVINPMADEINHLYRTMPSRSTSKCYADPTWKIAVSNQCFLVVKSSSPLHPKPTFCIFSYLDGSKPTRFVSKTAHPFQGNLGKSTKIPKPEFVLKIFGPPPY